MLNMIPIKSILTIGIWNHLNPPLEVKGMNPVSRSSRWVTDLAAPRGEGRVCVFFVFQ